MSDAPSPLRDRGGDDLDDWFEHAPCGHLLVDRDGRIARANTTFATWCGHSPAALTGKRLMDLLPVPGRIHHDTYLVPLLRLRGSYEEIAMDFLCADGARMPCLVNASERRDDQGRTLVTRMAIFRSADRRRYEQTLLQARDKAEAAALAGQEVAELREQFIAVLGHDMRNPLASIASGMRLLGKEPVSDRGRKVIALIEGSVLRATGLIENLLDFARGRLGGGITLQRNAAAPLEPILRQVVEEIRSIAPDRPLLVDFALADPIDCDRGRLGQLLSNLLGNALTHGAKDRPVIVEARTTDTVLEICVANGGEPIAAATMQRLFQPFYRGEVRSNRDGLGLGLHIASEIAKAHGGRLDVTSTEEATRFTFVMPLAR